ncbi:hypothetical protein MBLNU457_1884t1 [Dothideomycetes sp. NU457]
MRQGFAVAFAAAIAGAAAQSSSPSLNAYISIEPSTSSMMPNTTSTGPTTVTTTVSTCNSTPDSTVTISQIETITYCSMCEENNAATTHVTVYTTVMGGICTDMGQFTTTPTTYTVTESCTDATPTWATGSTDIPQGFTVARYTCSTCDTATTMTVTEPCGCEATSGVPAPASSAPATPAATPAATTPVGRAGGSPSAGPSATTVTEPCDECEKTPAPSSGSGFGAGSAASQASYGSVVTSAAGAPAPYSSGANWGNTSNITPFTGAAASFGFSGVSATVLAAAIGLLAIAL